MLRYFTLAISFIAALAWIGIASAQMPMTMGSYTPSPVSSSFSGVGDVKSAWGSWYGVVAYSAAYAAAGGKVFDISCNAGAITGTLTFNANGTINHAAISGCSGTISITKRYDQSGANKCSGGPCDMASANAGFAGSDTFLTSGCPVTTVITDCEQATGLSIAAPVISSNITQPFFLSIIYDRTTAGRGAYNNVFGGENFVQIGGDTTNDHAFCYAGDTSPVLAATDNALHTVQCTVNGTSTAMAVDANTPTTGLSAGNNTFIGGTSRFNIGIGETFTGYVYGMGERDGTMSTSDMSLIAANEATNSGAP